MKNENFEKKLEHNDEAGSEFNNRDSNKKLRDHEIEKVTKDFQDNSFKQDEYYEFSHYNYNNYNNDNEYHNASEYLYEQTIIDNIFKELVDKQLFIDPKFEISFEEKDKNEVMKLFGYDSKGLNLLKTRDSKAIYNQIFKVFQSFFKTKYGKQKIYLFYPTNDVNEIKRRFQFIEFCLKLPFNDISNEIFSVELPDVNIYDVCFITNDYKNYETLLTRYRHFPIFLVETKDDLNIAKDYIQVRTDSEDIANVLPNAVISEEPFPEYHVKRLLKIKDKLNRIKDYLPSNMRQIIEKLNEFEDDDVNFNEWFMNEIDLINEKIKQKISSLEFRGDEIISMIQEGKNEKIESLILDELTKLEERIRSKFNVNVILSDYIDIKFPIEIEEKIEELEKIIKQNRLYERFFQYYELYKMIGDADEFFNKLKNVLSELDFMLGIKKIINSFELKRPKFVEHGFKFKNGKNVFLVAKGIQVEPVEYNTLDSDLILLTGANSGGKTTLLQLISQIHILGLSGFYVPADAEIEFIEELYYFSKPTGKTDAGAFETLLKTFAKIKSKKRKLILADEIEAITEPGAAAKILIGILEWFRDKNAKIIIVTHLGEEIKEHITEGIRFDGIQAIGIEDGRLIVNRSPIKNIIAKSTPELIIEKLRTQDAFFEFIYKKIKEEIKR